METRYCWYNSIGMVPVSEQYIVLVTRTTTPWYSSYTEASSSNLCATPAATHHLHKLTHTRTTSTVLEFRHGWPHMIYYIKKSHPSCLGPRRPPRRQQHRVGWGGGGWSPAGSARRGTAPAAGKRSGWPCGPAQPPRTAAACGTQYQSAGSLKLQLPVLKIHFTNRFVPVLSLFKPGEAVSILIEY